MPIQPKRLSCGTAPLALLLAAALCVVPTMTGCGSKTSDPGASKTADPADPLKPTVKPPKGISLQSEPVSEKIDGHDVMLYHLKNSHGMMVSIINYGAIVTSVQTPDKNGDNAEITLNYNDLTKYAQNAPHFGAICGRYANRIANAQFVIDGKTYKLTGNNGPDDIHHLHGGKQGFSRRLWSPPAREEIIQTDDSISLKFVYISADGEEGYPGRLTTTVEYTLNNNNELKIEYTATTDKPTHVNLTSHCYWNLSGDRESDVLDHELTLKCDRYLPVDSELIPTGKLKPVKGTPWDFTVPKTIGQDIKHPDLGDEEAEGRGYDHCYVLQDGLADAKTGMAMIAHVYHPKSGRVMKVFTDQPGVQLYTGNFLKKEPGSTADGEYKTHAGFCLECQHFPDTPHHKDFPTTLLKKGEVYKQVTIYRFEVRE